MTSKKTGESAAFKGVTADLPKAPALPRVLIGHHVNECNEAITINTDERDPNNGNASHVYRLSIDPGEDRPSFVVDLCFQHGPIKEVGTNGITAEALIEILIDRFEGFQTGAYACEENAQALHGFNIAKAAMRSRTKKRVARGVEGTHEV
jgi:hypothetical protein